MDPNALSPEVLQQLMQAMAVRDQQSDARRQSDLQLEMNAQEGLGPEKRQQLAGMGTLDQRAQLFGQEARDRAGMLGQRAGSQNDLLGQQLAQAHAIRGKGKDFGTVGGNIAAGLGDAAGNFFGGLRERDILGQMGANNQAGFGGALGALDAGAAGQREVFGQQDALRGQFGEARLGALKNMFGGGQQSPAPQIPYYLAKP